MQISSTELAAYIEEILGDIPALRPKYLPITSENDLLSAFQDGILLAHYIKAVNPTLLDLPTIIPNGTEPTMNTLNVCVSALVRGGFTPEISNENETEMEFTPGAGGSETTITAEDFFHKNPTAVMNALRLLARAHLLREVSVLKHPQLIHLMEPGESLGAFLGLKEEILLTRWVNHQLAKGVFSTRRLNDLSVDLTDSEIYFALMHQISSSITDVERQRNVLDLIDSAKMVPEEERTGKVLEIARLLLGPPSPGFTALVTAQSIIDGQTLSNIALLTALFTRYLFIHLPSEPESRFLLLNRIASIENTAHNLSEKLITTASLLGQLESELAYERHTSTAEILSLKQELEKTRQEHQTASTRMRDELQDKLNAELEALTKKHMVEVAGLMTRVSEMQVKLEGAQVKEEKKKEMGRMGRMEALGTAQKLDDARETLRAQVAAVGGEGIEAPTVSAPTTPTDGAVPAQVSMTPTVPTKVTEQQYQFLLKAYEQLTSFVKDVLDENHQQKTSIYILTVKQQQSDKNITAEFFLFPAHIFAKINDLMAEKIRQFSENMINDQRAGVKKEKEKKKGVTPTLLP
ncbi:hypothetical protein HK102_006560 [Quaeritorhiza haematococci]|nr:hypothetical protein HK102_006560 [Quaeritorhiza haematococci]